MILDTHDIAFKVNLKLGRNLSLFFNTGSTCDKG